MSEWKHFKDSLCLAVIRCLEAQGCQVMDDDEWIRDRLEILSDPARHIRPGSHR